MPDNPPIAWFAKPEKHNYPAALAYLSLLYKPSRAEKLVAKLHKSDIVHFKSKDIFRASSLPLLGISNMRIASNNEKIKNGTSLSPLLLVRDSKNGKLIVADGYHRLCTVYAIDQNAEIPCKIV